MKVYEKIKEMSFLEMADFLESLDIDADNIYCRFLCPFASGECDELDDDDMPCNSVNVVHEFLNSEYSEKMVSNEKYEFISKITEEHCKHFPFVSQKEWSIFFSLLYHLIDLDGLLTVEQYVIVSQVADNLAELFLDGNRDGSCGEPYWDMSLKQYELLQSIFGKNSTRMYLPYNSVE